MDFFVTKRKKRGIATLQLTALIDIFSILIFFLIKGAYLGNASAAPPKDIKIPKSFSKESVQAAPQVIIKQNSVYFAMLNKELPLNAFRQKNQNSSQIQNLTSQLRKSNKELPRNATASGILINLIADARTPYRDIFDVVKIIRLAGADSILFIAESSGRR